jgi:probable F420-dependent oxidoreductase
VSDRVLDELGFYLLAGAGGEGPSALMHEARSGEAMGFGTAFISERWNVKEADALSGAACAVTERMQIALGATNHNSRHPMITASWATTLHRLSGGRFTLGIGRGIGPLHQLYGMPPITTAQMEEFALLMRRLWNGEMVVGYDGPLGQYGFLHLDASFRENIPLGIVAFGDNTLKLGGRLFDDVILHTYFAPETLQHCVRTVKQAAEEAGRNPDDVKVWSCLATVGDHLSEQVRRMKLVARLATYLQGYGDLMVQTNGWDPAVLARFREDEVVRSMPGAIDAKANDEQLQHIETILPAEWMQVAATGSPERCVARIRQEFDLGADRVILHGSSPDELAPIVAEYRATDRLVDPVLR